MENHVLKKENQIKYSRYLDCNVNEHRRSHSPVAPLKKYLTRPVAREQRSIFFGPNNECMLMLTQCKTF